MKSPFVCSVAFATLAFAFALPVHAQGVMKQSTDVFGQAFDDECVESERAAIDGASATILRTPGGVSAFVDLPTPVSGMYCYPPLNVLFDPTSGPAVPGYPEAFTFWAIYFNEPAQCLQGECSVADVLGINCANAEAGAVKLAGHVVGGGRLQLSGYLAVGEGPLGPLGCAPFWNVLGSAIHLAVAPHGMLVPSLLPSQIQTPPGGGPNFWFPAIFDPVN